MKQSSPVHAIVVVLIALIPLLYAGYIYPTLPETIPLHFNWEGKPDRFDHKSELWFPVILLSVVSIFVYLLVSNLSRIDPKKTAGQSPELYKKIAIVITVFLCAINLIIVHSAVSGSVQFSKLMLPLMGLFFSVLGNYMHSIKPNYFVGFRTPWTLENEDNWRKTHQLVGKLWVPGGILLMLLAFILPEKAAIIAFFTILLCIVFIPAVYSYLYFKKNSR